MSYDCWNLIFNGILAFSALFTIFSIVFSIRLYLKNKKEEKNKYWNDNLPVVSIGSPCDVFQSACDTDISYNDGEDPNGAILFRLGNFSKTAAWDVTLEFCREGDCKESFYSVWYQEVPVSYPFVLRDVGSYVEGVPVYSKYHIDPSTKETSYHEFKICDHLNNCYNDKRQENIKDLFLKCTYFSCLDHECAKKIESIFQIKVKCSCDKEKDSEVVIKSIIRKSYTVVI